MTILAALKYSFIFAYILCLAFYTYLKSYLFGCHQRAPPLHNRERSVAIVGGGIGGVGAAYALLRSGYTRVTIYEASGKLGGNAKTHTWQNDGGSITTGLSVLAWPVFFRNYIQLLAELNIETTTVRLPFFIHHRRQKSIFAHGRTASHTQEYTKDLRRWKRMVQLVRYVADYFSGTEASLYHLSLLNPFNVIPMRLLSLLFGVSNRFWNEIVVPMYASSFLSTRLSFVPASILPVIDQLISVQPDSIPTLQTWQETSIDVFHRMSEGATVKTNHRVNRVRVRRDHNQQISISIDDDSVVYDRVIFACHANAALQALMNGNTKIPSLLKVMLANVTYSGDDDPNLLDGIIHRDTSILPGDHAEELCRHYANYIDVRYDRRTSSFYHYNTFILSSWLPNVRAMGQDGEIEPMLVTYAPSDQPAPAIDAKKIVGKVDNRRAHPSLSLRNQAVAMLVRLVQGENGIYFCGNAVTPANGHDLSLLSGFAVAEKIGAQYPFRGKNPLASRDYERFKRMCVD